MLDNRIDTFLELCDVMNYRKTAENLKMTQPAVTQHIKFLENLYQCSLFHYTNRTLHKTAKGIVLEKHARSMVALHAVAKEELSRQEKLSIKIGSTKTIGEYMLHEVIAALVSRNEYDVHFVIDNTENLLNKLNHFALDLVLLEGYLAKDHYLYTKSSDEEMLGICAHDHRFAQQEVTLEEVMQEKLIVREPGSGTRRVLEHFLLSQGYSIDSFKNKAVISSNQMIEHLVLHHKGVSFVYDVIRRKNPRLASFKIKGSEIWHEFNFVYLNEDKANTIIDIIRRLIPQPVMPATPVPASSTRSTPILPNTKTLP